MIARIDAEWRVTADHWRKEKARADFVRMCRHERRRAFLARVFRVF